MNTHSLSLSYTFTLKLTHPYSSTLITTSIHPFLTVNHVVQGLSITPNLLPDVLSVPLKDSLLPGSMASALFYCQAFSRYVSHCAAAMTAINENRQTHLLTVQHTSLRYTIYVIRWCLIWHIFSVFIIQTMTKNSFRRSCREYSRRWDDVRTCKHQNSQEEGRRSFLFSVNKFP